MSDGLNESVTEEGERDLERRLRRLAVLGEPVRRRVYLYVCDQNHEVTRDEASAALGLSRPLVAFHMDKLVSHGLLEADFRRLSERQGPGAGRPSKLYRQSARDLELSLPPRRYALAARVLMRALRRSGVDGVKGDLETEAEGEGMRLGAEIRGRRGNDSIDRLILAVLDSQGYEPRITDEGLIRSYNCPFRGLMLEDRDLICGANLAMMRGMLRELGVACERAQLDPRPGTCCVAFLPASPVLAAI